MTLADFPQAVLGAVGMERRPRRVTVRDMDHSLKTVADVMRHGVLTVSESSSLRAVAQVMHEHRVHGVLVVGDGGDPLGWVTARGLLAHRGEDWRRIKAGAAIGEPCVRVAPSASVGSAIDTMAGAEATHLVVMRPGCRTPDGVVSDLDLVAYLAR